jgi:hypothetical protein
VKDVKDQLRRGASSLAIVVAAAGPILAFSQRACADNELRGAFGQHGTTAAIVMPNGRMAPDGEFGLGYSEVSPYQRYFLTQQFLPWLQGTYRYTSIAYRRYGTGSFAQNQSYKDKSVDVKLRLVKEGPYFPDISLGFRDIGGSGLFSGEYLAATRRIYDFDITGGLAWGNIGARGGLTNPFGYLSDSFKTADRYSKTTGTLGTSFFSGAEVAPYGAIEWYPSQFPDLSLKLEFDGNDYKSEPFGADLGARSPFNFGLVYRPFNWLDLAASYERGNTVGLRFILHTNFNTDTGVPKIADKAPFPVPISQPVAQRVEYNKPINSVALNSVLAASGMELTSADIRGSRAVLKVKTLPKGGIGESARQQILSAPGLRQFDTIELAGSDGSKFDVITGFSVKEDASNAGSEAVSTSGSPASQISGTKRQDEIDREISAALSGIGFKFEASAMSDRRIYLQFSQKTYRDHNVALVRAARVLAALAPISQTVLDVSEYANGVPVARQVFLRQDIVKAANYQASMDEAWTNSSSLDKESPDSPWKEDARAYPDFSWGISPRLRQSLGGPDNFYLYQIYGSASAEVNLTRNFSVSGALGTNIKNNFQNFTYEAPSNLPRVRTKIKDYLTGASTWIDSFHADYINHVGDSLFYRTSAGVYEWMYSGVGGEILYKRPGARWALGLDANYVWQRDFDGGFGLLDYSTLVGNLTYYHQLPIWGLDAQISVGRYLAQDVGATFTLSRQFENGIRFGVWATKTNVSAEQFGEGSFDKGFRVTIPFELFSTTHSKSSAEFAFAPLTRDGGQKVNMPKPLYGIVAGDRND